VLDCVATDTDSGEQDARFGPMGKQQCTDTGPLTKKRMETADEEFLDRTIKFIKKNQQAGKPWFAWINTSRMHFYTHLKPESDGVTGLGIFADGMVEHDGHVGQLLNLLDEMKAADNTIVIYSVDNGPHYNEWPDGGLTPFRGEKNTNWEGAYRVPSFIRWPGKIKPHQVSNEIISLQDWVPTLMAAVGDPNIVEELKQGHEANGKQFKVHLDGYNFLPYLTGEEKKGPRKAFYYFNDGGEMVGLRYNNWKLVFAEQRAHYFDVWSEPFVKLRIPKLFNLRTDPFERADTDSNNYRRWWTERVFVLVPSQVVTKEFIDTFTECPPRPKPATINVDDARTALKTGGSAGN
jgi:arylsulfatase